MRRVRATTIAILAAALLVGVGGPAPEAGAVGGGGYKHKRKATAAGKRPAHRPRSSVRTGRFVCDGPKCPASWGRPSAPRLDPVQRRTGAGDARQELELSVEEPATVPEGDGVKSLDLELGSPSATD
ncbi:MAG: hypothetical protein QNK03_00550 [Myxococcota bacterium]|nr:hypothetical protein [Myxococcota bacterium]